MDIVARRGQNQLIKVFAQEKAFSTSKSDHAYAADFRRLFNIFMEIPNRNRFLAAGMTGKTAVIARGGTLMRHDQGYDVGAD